MTTLTGKQNNDIGYKKYSWKNGGGNYTSNLCF
jgi:hypothetical protein